LYGYFRKYGFDCTIEVFSYIGEGYSANFEFKNNIDKFGEGLAEYISEAIEYYVNRHK
jgi:TipAS antibiotic-recognition domain.